MLAKNEMKLSLSTFKLLLNCQNVKMLWRLHQHMLTVLHLVTNLLYVY